MIEVGGYKAFRGTMLVTPQNSVLGPYTLTGDWIYIPQCGCWYGEGQSFPAEICKIVSED